MALLFALFLVLVGAPSYADDLQLIRAIPHSGYSEGLTYHKGYLWHALPKAIIQIDPKDGTILRRFKPATDYSESIVWFKERLWNVSYSNNGIYAGELGKEKLAFLKKGEVPEKHAWGITHDGQHLIITGNYSSELYFLDPKTLRVVRTIKTSVADLEDLAWDGKGIWASSFTQHRGKIFRLNPQTGHVEKFYSLPDPEACPIIDGLAYDGHGLWITGKHCPSIFYVRKPTERAITSRLPKK